MIAELDRWILEALKSYRLIYTVDDCGSGIHLVDALTPDGDNDIRRGQSELEMLADHIDAHVADRLAAIRNGGAAAPSPEPQAEPMTHAELKAAWDAPAKSEAEPATLNEPFGNSEQLEPATSGEVERRPVESDVRCESCGFSGPIADWPPARSSYSDIQCPRCDSTNNDHNAEFKRNMFSGARSHN